MTATTLSFTAAKRQYQSIVLAMAEDKGTKAATHLLLNLYTVLGIDAQWVATDLERAVHGMPLQQLDDPNHRETVHISAMHMEVNLTHAALALVECAQRLDKVNAFADRVRAKGLPVPEVAGRLLGLAATLRETVAALDAYGKVLCDEEPAT
jgi:hypothetical protein